MEQEKVKEKKYKVNLGELCVALTRLTGGRSTDYTGYFCELTPYMSLCKVIHHGRMITPEINKEKFIRNCKIEFSLTLRREGVTSPEFGPIKNPYPPICFDRLSVHLCDKLSDGSQVYDHIVDNGGRGDEETHWVVTPAGYEPVTTGEPRLIALNEEMMPNLLNVTISEHDVETLKSDMAKLLVTHALQTLSKSKSNDGGKV